MITVITGLTGSGKTWYMTQLIRRDWLSGAAAYINYPVFFNSKNDDIARWHQLDELFHLNNGVIGIDEGQKLFDARRWASLPVSFAEKIAQHRKHFLDIYTTTQDLGHIDLRVRSNIHEVFHCQSLLRFHKNDRVKPIFQILRITKKTRKLNSDSQRISFEKTGRAKMFFLSRFFTREYYNTYGDIGFQRYLCRIKKHNGRWIAKIYARDLLNQGKARL